MRTFRKRKDLDMKEVTISDDAWGVFEKYPKSDSESEKNKTSARKLEQFFRSRIRLSAACRTRVDFFCERERERGDE